MSAIAGADALELMRRRLRRFRAAARAEIDRLRPLTQSRFDGCERVAGDDDARNAVARLEDFLRAIDKAEEALS
jgi:hypothetical protein